MTIIYNGETEIEGGSHIVVGPVPEGSQLVLVCKVHGGKTQANTNVYKLYTAVVRVIIVRRPFAVVKNNG